MLQQTQVKTVVPYWTRWMRALPTLAALAGAKPERLHKLWEGLGYYTRVRNLQAAAQTILREHGGRFPTRFEDVLALPGVGRYTAGAICSIAFNQPQPVLDGNVMRVLTRLCGITVDPRERETNQRLWRLADQLVHRVADATFHASRVTDLSRRSPAKADDVSRFTVHSSGSCSHLNQSLMELGAVICTPRQPRCDTCPVAAYCAARMRGWVDRIPARGRRPPTTGRHFVAFVLRNGDRYLVRQRPGRVVNAHLWEFPNLEVPRGEIDLDQAGREVLGAMPKKIRPLCTIKHSITRYRITLDVFKASGDVSRPVSGRWLGLRDLRRLPFAGAHMKILRVLSGALP